MKKSTRSGVESCGDWTPKKIFNQQLKGEPLATGDTLGNIDKNITMFPKNDGKANEDIK